MNFKLFYLFSISYLPSYLLLSSLHSPSSLGWIATRLVYLFFMMGLILRDSIAFRSNLFGLGVTPFFIEKDSYNVFSVDGVLLQ